MEVRWLDQQATADRIPIAVEVIQTESAEFREHASSSLNVDAKEHNRAVLDYIKRELESMPGVQPDPRAELRVSIASVVPESSRNHALVGCLSVLSVFVFPVFAVYDYPVEITVYRGTRKVKTYEYSYSSAYAIGWLMMPFNLLVAPFDDGISATASARIEGVEDVFEYKVARINRWILKDLQSGQLN